MAPTTPERRYNSHPLTGDGLGGGVLLLALLIAIVLLMCR